jgi:hypothetical protein
MPLSAGSVNDGHSRRDPANRQEASQGTPLHVPEDHPQGGTQAGDAQPLGKRAPVAPRRRGTHRLGRRQPHGREDGRQRACDGGGQRDAAGKQREARVHPVLEAREMEELGIEADELGT